MTDNFPAFAAAVHKRLETLSSNELYQVEPPLDLIESYLSFFPEGTNPVFRVRTEHDCSCCKNFIRNFGRVVAIVDGEVQTVWGSLPNLPRPYDVVAAKMDQLVKQQPIVSVFRTKEPRYGTEWNYDKEMTGHRWYHFHGKVAKRHHTSAPDKARGDINTTFEVFKRGLTELNSEALTTVLDLIDANAIYRGAEFRGAVESFQRTQREYRESEAGDLYIWTNLDSRNARFRNTVIGTLIVDLSEGVDLEKAVKSFEAKVAPANYKRPTALITPQMIEQAVATLEELDLSDAIHRRFAKLEDVSVNDVLFVDNAVRGRMKGGLTDLLLSSNKVKPKSVGTPTDITIEDFMKLGAKSIELMLNNSQLGNFVSLTAPERESTGRLFKWDNDFAWSYDGEVADSMRQRVAEAGGRVDGPFRFTHSWNHEGRENQSLMDLHVFMPGNEHHKKDTRHATYGKGRRVGWNNRTDGASGGVQDVDYTSAAPKGYIPIENISFPDIKRMPEGKYICKVHNWNRRGANKGGFKAEIELNGVVYQYDYPAPLAHHEWVTVAEVTLKNGQFTIDHKLKSSAEPTDKWGVKTLTPVRVDTIMLSPNYWEGAGDVGNKHWFFILDGCKNPNPARGFFNEYLRSSLEKHRKVFEVLGAQTKCQPTDNQLSGVGFSSTRNDTVLAIADGRPYNVQF